jgi:hypothetical protein
MSTKQNGVTDADVDTSEMLPLPQGWRPALPADALILRKCSNNFSYEMCHVGEGHAWLAVSARVSPRIKAQIDAMLAEEDMEGELSIDQLAAELEVTRRTIERALMDRTLVPTRFEGKRARFSREWADRLKARAAEARERGMCQVMGVAAAAGSIVRSVRVKREDLSAQEWLRSVLWKRQNLPRQSPRAKSAGSTAKSREVRRIQPATLTPEEIKERDRQAAEGKRTCIRITIVASNLCREPHSVSWARESLYWLLKLARAEPGEDAAKVAEAIERFRGALSNGTVDRKKLNELSEAIPFAERLGPESGRLLRLGLANMVAWCERSRIFVGNRIRGKAPRP